MSITPLENIIEYLRDEDENQVNTEFIEEFVKSDNQETQKKIRNWMKGIYEFEKLGKDSISKSSSGMKKLLVEG